MKVLIHKDGGYGHYMGNGQFGISDLPYIFPDTMTIKSFIEYVKNSEGCEVQIENFEVKQVELVIFE